MGTTRVCLLRIFEKSVRTTIDNAKRKASISAAVRLEESDEIHLHLSNPFD
jgi:hypothetical protein